MTDHTSSDHYFSSNPNSRLNLQSIQLTLLDHEVEVLTANGVFSQRRLDPGTSVIFRYLPTPPATGNFIDLGCGWGPISIALAISSPQAQIFATDVNQRALDLAQRNAMHNHIRNIEFWQSEILLAQDVQFDLIWSNPPVRIGKPALKSLMLEWFNKLSDKGEAWFVMGKNLGADSFAVWINEQGYITEKQGSAKGFRVFRSQRLDT